MEHRFARHSTGACMCVCVCVSVCVCVRVREWVYVYVYVLLGRGFEFSSGFASPKRIFVVTLKEKLRIYLGSESKNV